MTLENFDVIVIGSGGGTKLVRPVAALGLKVAIIEERELGGTCLNRGCIPSKMLIHVADLAKLAKKSQKFELSLPPDFHLDFEKLIKRVNETVEKESLSIPPLYEKTEGVSLIRGRGRFIDNHTLQVGERTLRADKIFICTGASAHHPYQLEGLEGLPYMTYEKALKNTTLPPRMLVIGGGYIATELGYFYSALGCEVTFIVRGGLLKNEDWEVQEEFTRLFTQQERVFLKHQSNRVQYEKGVFQLETQDPQGKVKTFEAEALMVATGVVPNTEDLGLEHTDIKQDKQGYIQVDDLLQTSVKGVYAFGDVIGRHLFRHTANFEGEYLFNALFQSKKPYPIDYAPVPHAVFTHPQVAGVGSDEQTLKDKNIPYFKGLCHYKDSAMGMALLPEGGFVKLLFCQQTQQLLGAHIVGEEASNMIHMLITLMHKKGTLKDLLSMIYIHPALPEIVRNAARDALKNA